jgi:hypothetical protein
MARRDIIWVDGHRNNVFFFDEGGRVRAGVVDHDMILRPAGLADADDFVAQQAFRRARNTPAAREFVNAISGRPADARRMMDHVFEKMYPAAAPARAADGSGPPITPPPARVVPRDPDDDLLTAIEPRDPAVEAPSPLERRPQPRDGVPAALERPSATTLPPRYEDVLPPSPRPAAVAGPESPNIARFRGMLERGETPTIADLMALQRNPAEMRSLKTAPEAVRQRFNELERQLVYDPHDRAVVEHVKRTVPGLARREVRVHDFRTPGAKAGDVNTDRDYRVLYKNDAGDWIEVPRRAWEKKSHDVFAQLTGYDPGVARSLLSPADQKAWDALDASARKRKWAEMHQQLATDRWHPEASVDFSDQARVRGEIVMLKEANIVRVRNGEGELVDPHRLGMMYNEKADVYLRQRNPLEAMAQVNKGLQLLDEVRAGYTKLGLDAGRLSPRFRRASEAIQSLRPYDASITPAMIDAVERRLRQEGFTGIRGFKEALDSQFHALQAVRRVN